MPDKYVPSRPAKQEEKGPQITLITFKLAGEEYGVRIQQIKEVTITPPISRMPNTPKFIRGISNIRGQIVAIMSLEERFNLPVQSLETSASSFTLVLEHEDYHIGILVPEVPKSLSLPQENIDRTPSIFKDYNIDQAFIEGIGKVDSRLIIILDVYKILSAEEVMQLAKAQQS